MRYMHRSQRGAISTLAAVVAILATAETSQGSWHMETVSPLPIAGSVPALAFDRQDRAHVAYTGSSSYIQYTSRSDTGWSAPADTNLIRFGSQSTLHLAAADDRIFLAHSRVLADSWTGFKPITFVSTLEAGRWQPHPQLNNTAMVITGAAVDSAGRVNWIVNGAGITGTRPEGVTATGFYSVLQSGPGSLAVAAIGPYPIPVASWPGQAYVLGMDGDVAFDSAGTLHTLQFSGISGEGFLLYAKGASSGPFAVDANVDPGWHTKTGRPSIAIDGRDRPHIAFTTLWPSYGLRYGYLAEQGWQVQTVEEGGSDSGFTGTFADVLVTPDDVIHIVYADPLRGLLKHARLLSPNQWLIEVIDTVGTQADVKAMGGIQGFTGTLATAMDTAGGIGVTYWDADDAVLKYAYLPAPEPSTLWVLLAGVGWPRLPSSGRRGGAAGCPHTQKASTAPGVRR